MTAGQLADLNALLEQLLVDHRKDLSPGQVGDVLRVMDAITFIAVYKVTS